MKFDDIYIWNKRKEIIIYSVFEDKNYTIKSIENIYDFLNRNLGTKKKILLIKNTYSIPNSKEINEINFNYSLGCIYKNDFNLLKYSLNALVLNFAKISHSLFDNTPVNMLEAISEETNGTINVVELEKFVKSNTIFKELSSGIIENKKIDVNITPYYTNLKLKYTKEINELKSSNNRVRNLLLKELTNVNKQIDSLLKKKIRNKEMFNRKSLIELKISRLSTNFNRMKQRIDQKYSFILTDMDKYVKNIDTLMEKENLMLEKIINQENDNILKNEKILNEENENKQKQIEREKLQMAERKRKEKELLQKKAAEAKKAYLQKLAEKKKLMLEQKKKKEEAARVVMERNHRKKEEERKRKEELLRKQKEAAERKRRELEAKKRELYKKKKEKEEEAKRLAIEKQKKLEKDRIEKEKLNKIKLQRAEKLKALREKRKLELVELDKAKKRKLYDMVMNNNIVLGDTSIENFQKNNTHVNMKCIFQKNVNPNNNTCKNIFNKKKGNKVDDFKTVEDVAELITTIIALEKGIALSKQYFMIVRDNVIFSEDFEKKFIDLKFPSDYNIVRIVDDDINTFKLSDDIYDNDCVIYKTSYVKNYLLKFCKKMVGVYNYTLNKIPKSYVIGNDLLRYEQHKFVMIITSYNNSKWYLKNLDSVVNQTYKNWRIVYVDDCSTDNTYELVKKYIRNKNIENKVTLIRNESNMKQAYSRYIAFKECMDDEICCLLDGDDWLYDNNVLNKLNLFYNNNDVEVSYGQFKYFHEGKENSISGIKDFPDEIKNKKLYRHYGWISQHMRTGLAKHWKSYPISYIKDHNNRYFTAVTDLNEMVWVLEQSNGKHMNHGFVTYGYNKDASIERPNSYYNSTRFIETKIYRFESENFIRLNKLNKNDLEETIIIFSDNDWTNEDLRNICESINFKYRIILKNEIVPGINDIDFKVEHILFFNYSKITDELINNLSKYCNNFYSNIEFNKTILFDKDNLYVKLNNYKIVKKNFDEYNELYKYSVIIENNKSSIFNKFVKKIYCINIVEQNSRLNYFINIMKKYNINCEIIRVMKLEKNEKFKKIFHEIKSDIYYKYPSVKMGISSMGEFGCLISHIICLEDAIKHNYENIIIFEDDIIPIKDLVERFNNIKHILNDNSFVYLGCSQHSWYKNMEFYKDYYIPLRSMGAFALYLKKDFINDLYPIAKKYKIKIDKLMWKLYNDCTDGNWIYDNGYEIINKNSKYYKKSAVLFPNLFIADLRDSNIRNSRDMYKTGLKFKWDLEMYDFQKKLKNNLVIRILGNNVPELHGKNQTIKNLKFILENERNYAKIDKLFILNRIYDIKIKGEIIKLLKLHNQKFVEIPFDINNFKEIIDSSNIVDLTKKLDNFNKQNEEIKKKLDDFISKENYNILQAINFYIVNNNGSRNFCISYGKKLKYEWTYVLDGNSFIDINLAKEIINNNYKTNYLIIKQKRLDEKNYSNEDFLKNINIINDLPDREPQIAFNIKSKAIFNEKIPYGMSPKAELLAALNVPHENNDWDRWRRTICKKLNIPIRTVNEPFQFMSRIVRLTSFSKKNNILSNAFLRKYGMYLYLKDIKEKYDLQ